jgi:hypothetical protein
VRSCLVSVDCCRGYSSCFACTAAPQGQLALVQGPRHHVILFLLCAVSCQTVSVCLPSACVRIDNSFNVCFHSAAGPATAIRLASTHASRVGFTRALNLTTHQACVQCALKWVNSALGSCLCLTAVLRLLFYCHVRCVALLRWGLGAACLTKYCTELRCCDGMSCLLQVSAVCCRDLCLIVFLFVHGPASVDVPTLPGVFDERVSHFVHVQGPGPITVFGASLPVGIFPSRVDILMECVQKVVEAAAWASLPGAALPLV